MLTVSIHTFTNFSADITLPAPALRVLRLDMPLQISTILRGVSAVSARMQAVFQSGHLGKNCRHQSILKNTNIRKVFIWLGSLFVIALEMDSVRIHAFTNFTTNFTLPTPALQVLRLDVMSKMTAVLGGIFTICTAMLSILQSGHLALDSRHQLISNNVIKNSSIDYKTFICDSFGNGLGMHSCFCKLYCILHTANLRSACASPLRVFSGP